MLEAFRRGGVETDRLVAQYPREMALALADTRSLAYHDVDTLLNGCAELNNDQSFGLHMVDYTEMSMFGIYGYLLTLAPTVKRLLEIIETYYPIFYQGPPVTINFGERSCVFEYDIGGFPSETRRHSNEWTLRFFADLMAKRVGHRLFLMRTEFTNSAPADQSELAGVFGKNIHFNAPRTAFEFNLDILEETLEASSPYLLNILLDQAEHLLQETHQAESLIPNVKLSIMELLESGNAGIDTIARRLAMSRTTLNRRLAREGTSFRKLRDDVIFQVSSQVLRDTDIEVGRVALKLGFSELSAFDRSFRRISGISPTAFRRKF